MVRMCECGFATSDPAFLERHLDQFGHREHVPWPLLARLDPLPAGNTR